MVHTNTQRQALPTFEQFVTEMQPYLAVLAARDRDRLLRSIYQLAEIKIKFERERDDANSDLTELRSARKNLSAVQPLLQQILKIINEAQERYPDAMRTIADFLGDGLRDRENALGDGRDGEGMLEFPFETIVDYLKDAVDIAWHLEAIWATQIHPDLRTKVEQRLTNRKLGANPPVEAENTGAHEVPASKKSAGIDQWFIGEVARRLDEYRSKGARIKRYDKVISAVFRVAFRDFGQSDENIRTELRRRETRGRPKYRPLLVNDLRTVGQNLPSRRATPKKMSGQKKKK